MQSLKPLHQLKHDIETALPVCRFIQALEKSMKAIEPAVFAEIKRFRLVVGIFVSILIQ